MAKKRAARAAPRRSYAPKKKTRRAKPLNKSTKKPMQALGTFIGAMIPYAGAIVNSVKSKSIGPVSSAVMNKDNAINAAKGAAVGFIAGTAVGIVADKTGLKKPINKIKRSLKGFTGGIL